MTICCALLEVQKLMNDCVVMSKSHEVGNGCVGYQSTPRTKIFGFYQGPKLILKSYINLCRDMKFFVVLCILAAVFLQTSSSERTMREIGAQTGTDKVGI